MRFKFNKKILWIISIALCLIFIFLLAFFSAKGDSATADEPAHIANGMVKLQYGDFNFYIEQPPLIENIIALPLVLAKYKISNTFYKPQHPWTFGNNFLYNSGYSAKNILLLARLPIIFLFLGLCLFFYLLIYKITKSKLLSFFGLLLIGLEPTMMAHARLATVDFGATAFIFITVIVFFKALFNPTLKMGIITGLLIGLSLMAKTSALILLPYTGLIFILFCIINKKDWLTIRKILKCLTYSGLVAIIIVMLSYIFEFKTGYLTAEYGYKNFITWIGAPLFEYVKNIAQINGWVFKDYNQPQYILGKFSFSGWWYYYPIAFFLKTPILISLSFILSVFYLIRNFSKKINDKTMQIYLYSIIFVFSFFCAGMISKLNIGIRYMLPAYPFIFLSIILFLSDISKQISQKFIILIVSILSIYLVVINLLTYPSYLSYFNEFISAQNKDKMLIDSNLDWWQDRYRLNDYLEKNQINKIYVDGILVLPDATYLAEHGIMIDSKDANQSGYYAVGRFHYILSEYYNSDQSKSWSGMMKNAQLVKIIGDSIYIFKK